MSYSIKGKALLLSLFLSACAHGAATQPQTANGASQGGAPATLEAGGGRETDGPRFTRLRSAFLAGESRRVAPVEGGAVVVERETCNVWSDTGEQCDLDAIARKSFTPGYQQ